ncbi:MAG: YbaB/EbfC family nucleoid-associated protein [Candidatus Omnitrophica bacterium]|nr:YbaB/EbfC family nucleoid-associated protein [Candidatus Omnitrophota bacterium]
MFDKMKAFMDMQKKMQELKRELENNVFDAVSSDGIVKVTMNGAQEVKEIKIQKELSDMDKASLEKAVKDAYNKALKRSHELASQKMREITGFNLPGVT